MLLPPMKAESVSDRFIAYQKPRSTTHRSEDATKTIRIVSYKVPEGWSKDFNGPKQYGEPLTHEERFGWDPEEARQSRIHNLRAARAVLP